MVLKRVEVKSAARVGGVIYAVLGLVFGALFACVSLLGANFASSSDSNSPPPLIAGFFGAFAVVAFPVIYGLLGAVGAAISAWLYNALIGLTGGLRVELE